MKLIAKLGYFWMGCALVCSLGLPASSQLPQQLQIEQVEGYLVTPELLDFDESLLQQLQLPPKFQINVFASDLGNARNLTVAPDGTVYLTRRQQGDVLALKDTDSDGRADQVRTVASELKFVNGITIAQNRLYFVTDTHLYAADLLPDGSEGEVQTLISDLPDAGQHPNRTIAFAPDGLLYISIGSTCNSCDEPNEEHATILQAQPDGSQRRVYAKGLRNTIGFAWHPETGELWGMDHGSDWRGNEQPPEELNRIQESADYGWPFCYDERRPDVYLPAEPEGTTKEKYCTNTQAPVLTYTAHSAPLAMVFYTASQFPVEYRNDAFVTMRGSWNRNPPSGYKLVRVRYQNGEPVEFQDFVTGFLQADGKAQFGRPVGLARALDGSLLFTDDTNGVRADS